MEEIVIKVDGKEYQVKIEEGSDGKIKVYCGPDVYEIERKPHSDLPDLDFGSKESSEGKLIEAPLPGVVTAVGAKSGEIVKKGQMLVRLIAMKMENEVIAPREGKILEMRAKKDQTVNKGDVLVIFE